MPVRTALAAAASPWVTAQLAGPRRPAQVLARGRSALYLEVGGACVGLLARAAVRVPIGLRLDVGEVPEPGAHVEIGDGGCALHEMDVRVVRSVDVTVPRLPGLAGSALAQLLLPGRDARVDFAYAELPATALAGLAAGEPEAVRQLLGRGSGLTPTGDDVLAGWLVARQAAGRPDAAVIDAVGSCVRAATSSLSATLLRRATVGETVPEVRDLLRCLARHGVPVEELDRLLAVGSSSGAGLAIGVALGLAAGGAGS